MLPHAESTAYNEWALISEKSRKRIDYHFIDKTYSCNEAFANTSANIVKIKNQIFQTLPISSYYYSIANWL